ncbi:serine hydrolase [Phenylobacterium sp.]|uniref:serine hydrolase domain-containing protein n=1 Tax=Phenylobacterium sp. TaxID=1871053 RepID=UPI0025DF51F1|nr:serine hydrolase domain-containing protein [Phenylobacterium sp.]MBX3482112.1 beta-lactamase family protein [Phenylobacterium sp.]MCW5758603.1 beta-lactamase family protein [Phenylobacterium sp.]
MRWIGLAGALALATAAQAQVPAAPADPIGGVFARFKADDPGCAVGVEQKGQAPVYRGFGSADLEHGVPITPDTIFEAGSVSKQFTAAAILLLAADGKLALSDDIRKYLPEMPDYGRPITIDMLLSHTSGLRDWGEVAALAGWPRTSRIYTPQEVLLIAVRQKGLNYTPGEAYSYTNTGYNLAGLIVQRVSGRTLADFTKERLFQPLGMTHTSWRDDFRRVVQGRAIAYEPGQNGSWLQEMPFENTYGHGALLTTVGDLLIWNRALSEGRLGAGIAEKMAERATLTGGRRITYARGLMVLSWSGREEVSHSGATAAYRAWLARVPSTGLSVALLCNRADVNPVQVGHRVVDAVAPPPAAPTAARLASEPDLARIPGAYVDERTGNVLRVVADKGELRVRGGGAFQPQAEAGRYTGGGMDFTFAGDTVKRVDPAGETVTFARKAEWKPEEADLLPLAGAYSSPEAGGVLVVSVKGGVAVIAPADRPSAPYVIQPLYRDAFQGDGNLIRIVRDAKGKVTALRFTNSRVYALDFRRVDAR